MDKATYGTYQEMLCVVKFVLDTKNYCLKIQPNFDSKNSWKLRVFSDSDGAGDPETRISVTDFIIYVQNVPVCWRSTAQRGVTLSSSDADYVAMFEAVKEIRFIYFILKDIGIEVEVPIVVKTDNIGDLFMSQNSSTGVRSRHDDTRYHFTQRECGRRNRKSWICEIQWQWFWYFYEEWNTRWNFSGVLKILGVNACFVQCHKVTTQKLQNYSKMILCLWTWEYILYKK
jgi:hypothetical protein